MSMALGARQAANLWMLERVDQIDPAEAARLAVQVLGVYRSLLSPGTTPPVSRGAGATAQRRPASSSRRPSRPSRHEA